MSTPVRAAFRSRGLALVFALLSLAPAALVAQGSPPKPVFPTLDADAPPGTGVMRPCLAPLEGVRCGRFRVWEDRAARTGRTIDLAFIVADAIRPRPSDGDAVTFFNGGPGSSTTVIAAQAIPFFAALRQRRDLLFLDFRGVGASSNLDCGVPYPGGVASRFGSVFPLDHIRACRDRLARRARLDLYTSNHNVDDLEELRQWLKYTALNLIGGSYGTREIQVYLRRHPGSVRTVILKGIAPLFAPIYVHHARGLQQALDELVRECASQATCAAAYPSFGKTVDVVLSRVRRDPPKVEVAGETLRFGPGELGYALRGLLYARAAEVPALLTG
ncbi:MAG: alpha/beta hydrolase, partial [Acidobacteriota bacterium]